MRSPSRHGLALVLVLAAGAGGVASTAAFGRPGEGVAYRMLAAQKGVSMGEAIQMVERQFNARVVRTQVQEENGRTVYVLRLIVSDREVRIVRVDAATGAIL